MKQIVKFEVFLSNSEEPFIMVKPTHVFEEFFECKDIKELKKLDVAKFDFEWKIRSFVMSCKDVFRHVHVSKSVVFVDYSFG